MSAYWKDCIEAAVDEFQITLTPEQLAGLIDSIETGHEHYGMAHGHECIPNPADLENERLKKELKNEREKVFCRECKGKGTIYTNFLNRSSSTQCWKCHGEGKHSP